MRDILLILLLFVTFVIVIWGFKKRERLLQFPTLAAIAFAGYLLPQYTSLSSERLPGLAFEITVLITILSLLAAFAGYLRSRAPIRLFQNWAFDERRLTIAAAGCILVGAYFYWQVSRLAPDVSLEVGGAWTGPITLFVFLSRPLAIGMAIGLLVLVRRPSVGSLAVVAAGMPFYIDRIFVQARRGDLIELLIFVGLALYFGRRITPPRGVAVAAAAAVILFVNSVGDYRFVMLDKDRWTWTGAGIQEALSVDYIGNLKESFTSQAPDLENAVHLVHHAHSDMNFDYGTSLYDDFIRMYVPGQLIGFETKKSLQLELGVQNVSRYGRVRRLGTTETGIASAFTSFWFLGPLVFFAVGWLMHRWWLAAVRGNLGAQCVILVLTYASLRTIPFTTNRFFLEFVSIGFFLLPVLWLSRSQPATRRRYKGSMRTPVSAG